MIDLNEVQPIGLAPVRFDLDEIVQRLRGSAATWVPAHFPNGRRLADEWRLANIRGEAPRKQGSCVIALKGEHAGDWIDFDRNQGGGPISALEHASGFSGRALIEYAAEVAGSTPMAHSGAAERPRGERVKDAKREIEFILSRAVPIVGTIAETYLVGRGLEVPATPDLLFHPDLTYWDTRTGHAAMVAPVRNAADEIVAVHRTYLADDGSGKADLPKPRMMLGPVTGGAVRLAPIGEAGVLGMLTAWCEHHGIAYEGVPVGMIKRHIAGKGNADKDAVIASIRKLGFAPADDNEADALALLHWAIAKRSGER